MNRVEIIKRKIEQIESLLAEIKGELEVLGKEGETKPRKQRRVKEGLPSDEELQLEYNKLYQEFITSNSRVVVEEFIKGKSKAYLKAFCRANALTVDTTKVSKDKIADVVIQWLAQRKAITQKAT
ncbi:MAG: hypothetical protein ACUVS5_07505 [Anaerolineae bacterium]